MSDDRRRDASERGDLSEARMGKLSQLIEALPDMQWPERLDAYQRIYRQTDGRWPSRGSEAWFDWQYVRTQQMVTTAKGIGADGEPLPLAAQFEVKECQWNEQQVPVLLVPNSDPPRLVYFFRTFSFHPGTAASLATPPALQELNPERRGRIFVIDTGSNQNEPFDADEIDPYSGDDVYGHGQAIAELIDTLSGEEVQVHLRGVDFFKGSVLDKAGNPCIPIFELTDPDTGDTFVFRGFDSAALESTLSRVYSELKLGDVVCLSLGTVACPDDLTADPVADWLRKFTAKGVEVVVAAGNHGCDVPSWPAAYATGPGGVDPIGANRGAGAVAGTAGAGRVFSVGSGTVSKPDKFSARSVAQSINPRDQWVTDWADGSAVPVAHPKFARRPDPKNKGQMLPNATWSGTSFAAPRFAATLLKEVSAEQAGRPGARPMAAAGDKAVVGEVAGVEAETVIDLNELSLLGRAKAAVLNYTKKSR